MLSLNVNGKAYEVDAELDTPLLWVIRDHIGLTGTKFGCGIAYCGACSVKVGGNLVRSCSYPASAVGDQLVETIESLASNHVQQAWQDLDVPQCGYCQAGMIMAATHLLESNSAPTDEEIDQAITNICRCGTYSRIRAAIHQAASAHNGQSVGGTGNVIYSNDINDAGGTSELFYDASKMEEA